MARLQGISGGMSGKTGSYTFRQSRGQTIVSQYQPVVKNPNTQGQQDQRARFKLMSQLAAIMAAGFGTMGVTKRPGKQRPTQRNAFTAINMPAVVADNGVAKIRMELVKLTTSSKPLGTMAQEAPDVANIIVDNINNEVKSVRFVEVVYNNFTEADPATGTFVTKTRPEIQRIVDVPVAELASRQCEFLTENGATVLAYGLIPSESLSGVDFDNIHTPEDDDFIAAVTLDQMVSNGLMAETMTLGVNVQTT